MEIEQDQDYAYDDYYGNDGGANDEDESWKVRRASVRLLDSILRYQKHTIDAIMKRNTISNLKDRLKEKDETIRNDTFIALESFFKAITVLSDAQP